MADLGRWLSGDYRVPIRQNEIEDDTQPGTPGVSTEDPEA
jgi:endogenous inhibitor of DNA gyrase (YacG/DUF329 family)